MLVPATLDFLKLFVLVPDDGLRMSRRGAWKHRDVAVLGPAARDPKVALPVPGDPGVTFAACRAPVPFYPAVIWSAIATHPNMATLSANRSPVAGNPLTLPESTCNPEISGT